MKFCSLSDKAIEEELGRRIKALRLRKNITQKNLANTTRLSINTIKSLEVGLGKISTVIAVLRELEATDQLNNFIPEETISPLQLVKMQGKKRERASSKISGKANDEEGESEW